MDKKITLQPLQENTQELLRRWRNANRSSFISQEIITKDMQKEWFKKYKRQKKDTVYIVYCGKKAVGTISVTERRDVIEVGRVILGVKRYARQGVMGHALDYILHEYHGKKIWLRVLKTNHVALQFYQKHHFVIAQEENSCYSMQYQCALDKSHRG